MSEATAERSKVTTPAVTVVGVVRVIFVVPSLQIVSAGGVAVTTGVGSTVISTSTSGKSQRLYILGVIIYLMVWGMLSLLIRDWLIVNGLPPLPSLKPVI